MTTVTYEVVEHDGGWAYRVGETYSETYPTHDAAAAAARVAAGEQRVGGETAGIVYEDEKGRWHGEIAEGGDRPDTDVKA
ncbi:MAG: DUF2188 domain-containing protein [Caulobacter sp.]|nr:DUF2188 domain-containing protein [Caulobacter sp.]